MRSQKTFIIASFFCIWIVITYLLLIRQNTEADDNRKQMLRKIADLETVIKEESSLNDELKDKLVNAIRLRDAMQIASANLNVTSIISGEQHNNEINSNNKPDGSMQIIQELQLEENVNSRNNISAIRQNLKYDEFKGPVIPVLVFACNRVSVRQCLDNLIEYRPNVYQFPIIVSQVSVPVFLFFIIAKTANNTVR